MNRERSQDLLMSRRLPAYRREVVAFRLHRVEDVHTQLRAADGLPDPQFGWCLADRVGDGRIGVEVRRRVLHAAQEPGNLEDRLMEFAGRRAAARR